MKITCSVVRKANQVYWTLPSERNRQRATQCLILYQKSYSFHFFSAIVCCLLVSDDK